MPAFLEDYLHAHFIGCGTMFCWAGGVEELLILEVESLQRKTCSVIGHGILAGKYLAEYRDSLK
jgi:hypothetical protein